VTYLFAITVISAITAQTLPNTRTYHWNEKKTKITGKYPN